MKFSRIAIATAIAALPLLAVACNRTPSGMDAPPAARYDGDPPPPPPPDTTRGDGGGVKGGGG